MLTGIWSSPAISGPLMPSSSAISNTVRVRSPRRVRSRSSCCATALGRWLAGVLGVGVIWRVRPRIGLWAAVQGLAAIQRPTFVLRDPGPEVVLFDTDVLSARLTLGVELRIGAPR